MNEKLRKHFMGGFDCALHRWVLAERAGEISRVKEFTKYLPDVADAMSRLHKDDRDTVQPLWRMLSLRMVEQCCGEMVKLEYIKRLPYDTVESDSEIPQEKKVGPFSKKEVAKRLGVSVDTVSRRIKQGKLRFCSIGREQGFYHVDDFQSNSSIPAQGRLTAN